MRGKKTGIVFILAAVLSLLTCACCSAMPKVVGMELPNHLKLLIFEEHSVPAVTFELLVSAGSWLDPPGMDGLANLTAKSVLLGTRYFSFEEINDKLDFIGATLDADCSKDFAMIGMQMLKKDLDTGVDLFTEIVMHPSFPAADVASEKDEIIGSLQQDEDHPLKIASRAFDKALFEGSPYAGSVKGTEKSVAAIGPEQLAKFYASFYRPNNSVLVIGGDITPQEVKTRIVPRLLGWKAAEIPAPPFRKEFAKGSVEVAIDKPVSQATIIIGCPAMDRSDKDYYPFRVMNQILGSGDLSSRLMTDIRAKRGLAYSVGSYLAAYKHEGSFRVVLQTGNASVKEAIALVQKELERLRSEPVSEAELQMAKEFLIGNFPLRYSLPRNFAKFLAQVEFYGLGPDYPERYSGLIDAVTADDVLRVAKKYLKPQNVVVVVGNLKKVN